MQSFFALLSVFLTAKVPSSNSLVVPRDRKSAVFSHDAAATNSNPTSVMIDPTVDLKQQLYKLAASFNRGFGATPDARQSVERIIQCLQQQTNDERRNIADFVYQENTVSVLDGTYRMIWTTALDVLLLEVSPVVSTGAIHQVFQGLSVTNVIDFSPRVQSLLPTLNSMIRAKVQTRACPPSRNDNALGNRVGLIFESVQAQPQQFFGLDATMFPPFAFDLPKLPGTGDESPGYFDVVYLDDDLLIIQQSQPGGLFALVRVDSIDS